MCRFSVPPGYVRSKPPERPKLGPLIPVNAAILEADKTTPPKQRHTAKRIYDNLKIAVARIRGDGKRQRTRAFTELVSHYLFQERFGRPWKGNDKDKVEALVKYSQANFLHSRAACVTIRGTQRRSGGTLRCPPEGMRRPPRADDWGKAGCGSSVVAHTRSDRRCLVERSGFNVRTLLGCNHFLLCHRDCVEEGLHRRSAKAPATLMWSRLIVLAHPCIEIGLQPID
jgi:hypothetical protein